MYTLTVESLNIISYHAKMAGASVSETTVKDELSTRKLQVSAQEKMPQLFRVTVEPSAIETVVGTKSARSAYSV